MGLLEDLCDTVASQQIWSYSVVVVDYNSYKI